MCNLYIQKNNPFFYEYLIFLLPFSSNIYFPLFSIIILFNEFSRERKVFTQTIISNTNCIQRKHTQKSPNFFESEIQ